MGRRPVDFFADDATFFGADLPFQRAQRCFIAAEMRLRAAAVIVRLRGASCDDSDLGGRPRRGLGCVFNPSRALMA
jgi:hypothetical protein